jgi:hypothetical protein
MHMDVALDHRGKHARFAVIRNYQPARIERELLAQVFDIVHRNATMAAEPARAEPPTHVHDDDASEQTCDRFARNQHVESDPAA